MIVPSKRRYLTTAEANGLHAGCHCNIDSGLGGSFSLRFQSWTDGGKTARLIVENAQSSFNRTQFKLPRADLPDRLYYLVPENPAFGEASRPIGGRAAQR